MNQFAGIVPLTDVTEEGQKVAFTGRNEALNLIVVHYDKNPIDASDVAGRMIHIANELKPKGYDIVFVFPQETRVSISASGVFSKMASMVSFLNIMHMDGNRVHVVTNGNTTLNFTLTISSVVERAREMRRHATEILCWEHILNSRSGGEDS